MKTRRISIPQIVFTIFFLGLIIISLVFYSSNYKQTPKILPSNFVFAVLPDTQLYSRFRPTIFETQTQWIVDNKESENIQYVLHVGDIVNEAFDTKQWERASDAMAILENNGINYAVVTGNHDVDYQRANVDDHFYFDNMRPDNENFPVYFSAERQATMPTYGGISPNGFNSYHLVECGDYQIMILALDWLPGEESLEWAQEILKKYPSTPTIILKHSFIKPRKQDFNSDMRFSSEECRENWEMFKEYDQIFLTVNGHHTGSDFGVMKNSYDHDVFLMCADYQSLIKGGNGWMRLLTLNFENGTIDGKTPSPYVMTIPQNERTEEDLEYLDDDRNQFSYPFDLKTRFEEISKLH